MNNRNEGSVKQENDWTNSHCPDFGIFVKLQTSVQRLNPELQQGAQKCDHF